MADEIIRELWRIKDEIAREHGYDLDALVAHLRRENLRAGRAVVELDSRRRGFSVGEERGRFTTTGMMPMPIRSKQKAVSAEDIRAQCEPARGF